jgi:multiple sugar transport system permease protein
LKTAGIELAEKRVVAPAAQRRRRMIKSDYIWGYLMIAPLMIGLLIFYIWPVFQTFYFSFTTWGAFGKYHWSGLSNYQQLLSDPDLLGALRNTFVYTAISVPCGIALSMLVAVLLNQKICGTSIYRTLYFLPVVTMPAAIAVVWRWLYNGDYGVINYLLSLVSIRGPYWVSDPHVALYAIILIAIWSSVGYNMILFLAGLQGIPRTYYEAAAIDGAGRVPTFFRITLPLLSPTTFFALVISVINALQVFDLVYLIAGAGNGGDLALESMQTVVYLFYKDAFVLDNKGFAAAIAMLLFVIILIITIVQMQLQKRWVYYS